MTHIFFEESKEKCLGEWPRREERNIIQTKRKWQVFDSSDDHNDKK